MHEIGCKVGWLGAAAAYLRPDLRRLLGVHHAHVLKVLEGVLPVLLLGAHVLLQQAEDVTGLNRAGHTHTHTHINAAFGL